MSIDAIVFMTVLLYGTGVDNIVVFSTTVMKLGMTKISCSDSEHTSVVAANLSLWVTSGDRG
jgi:hypothetical protein